jgi:hypothetical protein
MEASQVHPSASGGPAETSGAPAGAQPLSRSMRLILVVASALVFIAGFQLFVLTEMTDRFFAWTIQSHLTAAFLGGAYWSSCALEFLASRQRAWAHARIAVPPVLLFTTLTLVTTLLHMDKFHMDGTKFELYTRMATWAWIAVYALVPIMMTLSWIAQARVPGQDPPRRAPLPGWLRAILGLHALLLLGLGLALFIVPAKTLSLWPWALTELTARAVGAWLLGLGLAAAQAVWENDWERVAVAPMTYLVFGMLQLIALARYASELKGWGEPAVVIYMLFILSMLGVGVYGRLVGRRQKLTSS